MPSDPLYGKFDAVLARCIEKFDDTQKQADRSHHDLSILRKFLEGWFCVSVMCSVLNIGFPAIFYFMNFSYTNSGYLLTLAPII